MVTDQEIAALREDIAQGRPWIPDGWRPGAPTRNTYRYDDAIPLAIAAMVEWGGHEPRDWYEVSRMPISNEWEVMLRDCDADEIHDATAPTLYLTMRAACLAAIGAQDDDLLVDGEVNGWGPGVDAVLDMDAADSLAALQARIAALEAELRDEKYGKAIANVAAMGEVAAESVELVRQQDARIAAIEAELALRDQLETAGYSINREYNNRETWTARRWGVNQSQHNTADEARAAAVRLLEGDAT